jgi:hypothetical protein
MRPLIFDDRHPGVPVVTTEGFGMRGIPSRISLARRQCLLELGIGSYRLLSLTLNAKEYPLIEKEQRFIHWPS